MSRDLTLDRLRQAFHLPREAAAEALGVTVNELKKALRNQKIERWPYRKLSSLHTLQADLDQQLQSIEENQNTDAATSTHAQELREIKARIADDIASIMRDPNHPLDEALHKLRLQNYKARFLERHGAGQRPMLKLGAALAAAQAAQAEKAAAAAAAAAEEADGRLMMGASGESTGDGPYLGRRSGGLLAKRSADIANMEAHGSMGLSGSMYDDGMDDDTASGRSGGRARRNNRTVQRPGGLDPALASQLGAMHPAYARAAFAAPYGAAGAGGLPTAFNYLTHGHMSVALPMLPENEVLPAAATMHMRGAVSAPLYNEATGLMPEYFATMGAQQLGRAGGSVVTSGLNAGVAAIRLQQPGTQVRPQQLDLLGGSWAASNFQQPFRSHQQLSTLQQQFAVQNAGAQQVMQPQGLQPQAQDARFLSCPANWAGMAEAGTSNADTFAVGPAGLMQRPDGTTGPQFSLQPGPAAPMPGMAGSMQSAARNAGAVSWGAGGPGGAPHFGSQVLQGTAQRAEFASAWTAPNVMQYARGGVQPPAHAGLPHSLPVVEPLPTPLEDLLMGSNMQQQQLQQQQAVGGGANTASAALNFNMVQSQPLAVFGGNSAAGGQLSAPTFGVASVQGLQQAGGALAQGASASSAAGTSSQQVVASSGLLLQTQQGGQVAQVQLQPGQQGQGLNTTSLFLLNSSDDDDENLRAMFGSPDAVKQQQQLQLQQAAAGPITHQSLVGLGNAAAMQAGAAAHASAPIGNQQQQQQAAVDQGVVKQEGGGVAAAQQQQQQQQLSQNAATSSGTSGGALEQLLAQQAQQQQAQQQQQQQLLSLYQAQQQQQQQGGLQLNVSGPFLTPYQRSQLLQQQQRQQQQQQQGFLSLPLYQQQGGLGQDQQQQAMQFQAASLQAMPQGLQQLQEQQAAAQQAQAQAQQQAVQQQQQQQQQPQAMAPVILPDGDMGLQGMWEDT